MKFSLPKGYKGFTAFSGADFLHLPLPSHASVIENGCAEVDEIVDWTGQISGRVRDANGHPVADLKLILVKNSESSIPGEEFKVDQAWTDERGSYRFRELAPGSYIPTVNLMTAPIHRTPFPPTYYPGLKQGGQPIQLAFAQRVISADIRLLPRLEELKIPFTITWPDGGRAEGATLTVTDSAEPDNSFICEKSEQCGLHYGFARTEAPDTIMLFPGRRYYVGSYIDIPDGKERTQQCAEPVEVSPSADAAPIKLAIDHQGRRCAFPKAASDASD